MEIDNLGDEIPNLSAENEFSMESEAKALALFGRAREAISKDGTGQ
jgi:hypothetical protein